MRLFFFGKVSSDTSQKLLAEVERISEHSIEIFQTVSTLAVRLKQIEAKPEAFMFAPGTNQELSELIAHKNLFNDRPIILVLPERNNLTIHEGHLLMPRFLTFWDDNLAEVKDVLTKIQVSKIATLNTQLESS